MVKQAPFKPTDIGDCSLWLDGADPAGTGIKPSNGATLLVVQDKVDISVKFVSTIAF